MVAVLLGVYNFANQMGQAILVLLATQTLHVGSRGYGFLLAATAVGSVIGGLVCPVLARRLGSWLRWSSGARSTPPSSSASGWPPDAAVAAVLLAGQGFGVTLWNVVTVSLRQQIVPSDLLGRVNSVYRMLGWGLMPVGALAGGFIAHAAGLRAPYVVAGAPLRPQPAGRAPAPAVRLPGFPYASRRSSTTAVTAMRAAARTRKMPVSMPWNVQKRSAGW